MHRAIKRQASASGVHRTILMDVILTLLRNGPTSTVAAGLVVLAPS